MDPKWDEVNGIFDGGRKLQGANDAAARAQELRRQAEAAQASLLDATRRVEDLQKANEDLFRAARAQVDEMIAAAEAVAEETVRSAQKTADDLLQQSRERAQQEMRTAEDSVAAHWARLMADSDRLVQETTARVAALKGTAEQYISVFAAKVQAFLAEGEGFSRRLETLVTNHTDSMEAVARLNAEMRNEILPGLQRLTDSVTEEAAAGVLDLNPAAPSEDAAAADGALRFDLPSSAAERTPGRSAEPSSLRHGEIIVSPVHSFRQASKLAAAFSQISGIKSVKVRTYSNAKAVLDVVTAGQTMKDIDVKLVDGVALDVVEVTDTRLALRIDVKGPRFSPR